ncbi:hypothetical protein BASA81_005279 [Batrachochytrium salamandrivorans]|nr:hypothetical protein BASA62_002864 [Batrachochytrium salamandrivorans]KAH9256587.1 hypothetical protein BASA81_005279 [Batrachochytrium salamandrivorans]
MLFLFSLILVLLVLWKYFGLSRTSLASSTLKRICIVLGSGGHTMEMLTIIKDINHQIFTQRFYVIASSDQTSESKVHSYEQEIHQHQSTALDFKSPSQNYSVLWIPRSRELHQPWLSTTKSTLQAAWVSLTLLYSNPPDVILCNGPGTCVPMAVLAVWLRCMGIINTRVVYVESLARVQDLSLSGKILYRIVDQFVVQWPQLKMKYPNAVYVGRLV